MIDHQVWFKLKDSATEDDKQAMLGALRGLPSQIEDIEHLACGEDFSGRSRGFHIGLALRCQSREALARYSSHPTHEAFVERFKSLWDDVMALDFESDSAQ